jgi:putative toxin-antitoxin system antitoxin component (TIGR02293 family)
VDKKNIQMNEYIAVGILMKEHGIVHQPIQSYIDLIRIAREGLPVRALTQLMQYLELSPSELRWLMDMSQSTFQRRKKSKLLTTAEGERLVQLYQLIQKGLEIFEDKEDFLDWFKSRNQALGDVKPMELLRSQLGMHEVSELLGRIEYGIYS